MPLLAAGNLTCGLDQQVLWEMLTREVPFNGLEGLQVAWLVVEKNEVHFRCLTHSFSLGMMGINLDSAGM